MRSKSRYVFGGVFRAWRDSEELGFLLSFKLSVPEAVAVEISPNVRPPGKHAPKCWNHEGNLTWYPSPASQ